MLRYVFKVTHLKIKQVLRKQATLSDCVILGMFHETSPRNLTLDVQQTTYSRSHHHLYSKPRSPIIHILNPHYPYISPFLFHSSPPPLLPLHYPHFIPPRPRPLITPTLAPFDSIPAPLITVTLTPFYSTPDPLITITLVFIFIYLFHSNPPS